MCKKRILFVGSSEMVGGWFVNDHDKRLEASFFGFPAERGEQELMSFMHAVKDSYGCNVTVNG